ncbi:MAG: hypothetical protein ACRDCC_08285 [Culicoidibacterales bacterium]
MIRTLMQLLGFSPYTENSNHYFWKITERISLHFHPSTNEINFFYNDFKFEKTKIKATTLDELHFLKKHNALNNPFEYALSFTK